VLLEVQDLVKPDGRVSSIARAYVDDIILASDNVEDHLEHLSRLLAAFKVSNLTVNPSKCVWLQRQVPFLGHIVDGTGIRTDPDKIKRVLEWSRPKSKKDLQRFLGFCNYYRRFYENYALKTAVFADLLEHRAPFVWTEEHEAAFVQLKEAFQNPAVLANPVYDGRPFFIATDASEAGIGGALHQRDDNGNLMTIAFTIAFAASQRTQ
jgi:hypothetical protein